MGAIFIKHSFLKYEEKKYDIFLKFNILEYIYQKFKLKYDI